jgi:hypothetical protein
VAALIGAALGFTQAARADQFWVAWEGNDFPENEGWERRLNGVGPAQRTIADGIMTMDGLADRQIDDYYRMVRPLNPGPGEEFVAQWRLRVDEVDGSPLALYDPGVSINADDGWAVSFLFGTDFILSFYEDLEFPMAADEFHVFEFHSSDMRTYNLFVDDHLLYSGLFWSGLRESTIDWGDRARGSASLSDWDYLRYGAVPEPSTAFLFAAFLVSANRRHGGLS